MFRRSAGAAASVALLALTACSSGPLVTTQSCIDWVYFETPAAAVEEADAVAIGRLGDEVDPTTYMGMRASRWNVEVDEWQKGAGGSEIVVTSLPRSCGDETESFDEFRDADAVVLFLRDDADGWHVITPHQGLVLPGPDGGIPSEWPAEQG
ncbi:hypothetical protein [Microbacterium sp.]|uniref:hypothetical protein n=1 Tax=Microbacterium sp. TaxID=51671 RepID=UPI0039E57BE7